MRSTCSQRKARMNVIMSCKNIVFFQVFAEYGSQGTRILKSETIRVADTSRNHPQVLVSGKVRAGKFSRRWPLGTRNGLVSVGTRQASWRQGRVPATDVP